MADIVTTETNLIKSDFEYENLVTCPKGKYTELCIKQVDMEEIMYFGYGDKDDGVDDRGLCEISLLDNQSTPNEAKGKIRFKSRDKGDIRKFVSMAPRTEILKHGKGKKLARKDVNIGARQEKYLVLEFMPDTDIIVNMGNQNTKLDVPVTILQSPDFR